MHMFSEEESVFIMILNLMDAHNLVTLIVIIAVVCLQETPQGTTNSFKYDVSLMWTFCITQ